MTMLSPLRPLLCRHDYYWSERHLAERCRRCGKLTGMEAPRGQTAAPAAFQAPAYQPPVAELMDIPRFETPITPAPVRRAIPSGKALKAQAKARRENLMSLLDRLAEGDQPNREEAIDAVLAVIEDAHSADPVLFGTDAASHFARLHDARDRFPV